MMRMLFVAAAFAAVVAGMPGTALACLACENGDGFLQVAPHPFGGECRWRSANSSDQGIEAVLYGYAAVGDGTGAGVTIRCWLEYGNGVDVPGTHTQTGAPGSAAATARQITVPLGVATRVCAYAQALFVTPDPAQTYKTPICP